MTNKFYLPALRKMQQSALWVPITGVTQTGLTTRINLGALAASYGLANGDLVSIGSETQNELGGNNTFNPAIILLPDLAVSSLDVPANSFNVPVDITGQPAWSAANPGFVVPQFDDAQLKANGGIIRVFEDDLAVALVNTDDGVPYVFSNTHEFLSDITAFADGLVDHSALNPTLPRFLRNKQLLNTPVSPIGVAFKADPITIESVPASLTQDINAIVIFKWTGLAATSPLIFYIDVGINLNVLPDGADAVLIWAGADLYIWRIKYFC